MASKSPNPPFGKPLGINDVDSYQGLEGMGRRIEPHGEQRVMYGNSGTNQGTGLLPITDTQRSLRNFEGYEKNQWYSLGELQEGAYGGTTESDSQTETAEDHAHKGNSKDPKYGYAAQQKSGKGGRPTKMSSKKGWY